MGRPRKPRDLKVLQGTLQKCRDSKNEPKPRRGIPKPRRELPKNAKKLYGKLAKMLNELGILTVADRWSLELLACALAEYQEAVRVLGEKGQTYQSMNLKGETLIRPRPEVVMASNAFRRAAMMLARFGLDPSNRSKVVAIPEKKENPWDEI